MHTECTMHKLIKLPFESSNLTHCTGHDGTRCPFADQYTFMGILWTVYGILSEIPVKSKRESGGHHTKLAKYSS